MILNVYVCFRYCDLLFVDKLWSMYHKVHGKKEGFCWAALACLLRVPGDIGCTIGVDLASLHVGAGPQTFLWCLQWLKRLFLEKDSYL